MTEAESEREGRRGREGERKESERLIWRCYPAGFEDRETWAKELQVASRSWEKVRNRFFPRASRRNTVLLTVWF